MVLDTLTYKESVRDVYNRIMRINNKLIEKGMYDFNKKNYNCMLNVLMENTKTCIGNSIVYSPIELVKSFILVNLLLNKLDRGYLIIRGQDLVENSFGRGNFNTNSIRERDVLYIVCDMLNNDYNQELVINLLSHRYMEGKRTVIIFTKSVSEATDRYALIDKHLYDEQGIARGNFLYYDLFEIRRKNYKRGFWKGAEPVNETNN